MKILIIGGYGTIGKTVAASLQDAHDIVIAGRNKGDIQVDITNTKSIEKMYQSLPNLDAVVCIAGEAKWDYLDTLSEEDFYTGIRSKLMGQINLVRLGRNYIKNGGSFTLTTGILADDPVPMTTSAAMVNGAIHSFVKAAALELDKGHRINVVSAGLVEDAKVKYEDYFPRHNPVPMYKVANAYKKSVLGKINGEIIRVYE